MSGILVGDCLDIMPTLAAESIDAIVTDPPYGLEFMGKDWDRLDWRDGGGFSKPGIGDRPTAWTSYGGETANPTCATCGGRKRGARKCGCESPDWRVKGEVMTDRTANRSRAMQDWHYRWAVEALRVAKPGAHLLAFGGTRTYHRLACAIEDAGWEVRDCLVYAYAQGFPKSLNVSKQPGVCHCGAEPKTEHEVRPVRDADVSQAIRDGSGVGSVLLPSLPLDGRAPDPHTAAESLWGGEPGMEGRGDVLQDARELHGSSLSSGTGMGAADGEGGRLHHGASAGHGGMGGAAAVADGGGEPREPRSERQPPREPDALAHERGSQAVRVWPDCPRCGLPVVEGWGTALKPAWEPIILARKPLRGTVAANVTEYGTGALNIDGCRIGTTKDTPASPRRAAQNAAYGDLSNDPATGSGWDANLGRWPANLVLTDPIFDGDVEGVVGGGEASGFRGQRDLQETPSAYFGADKHPGFREGYGDSGTYSRFFQLQEGDGCYLCGRARSADESSSPRRSSVASAPDPAPTGASRDSATTTDSPTTSATAMPFWPDADVSTPSIPRGRQRATSPASERPSGPARSPAANGTATDTTTTTGDRWTCATCADLITSDSTSVYHAPGDTRFLLIPKASRSDREPRAGGLDKRPVSYMNTHGGNADKGEAWHPVDDRTGETRDRFASAARANHHPTVKPVALMRHLVRLVTPPGGTVLDPFLGSGTTAIACEEEGFGWVGIEKEPEYVKIAGARLAAVQRGLGL